MHVTSPSVCEHMFCTKTVVSVFGLFKECPCFSMAEAGWRKQFYLLPPELWEKVLCWLHLEDVGLGSVGLIELEELFIEEEVVKWIARYCTSTEQIEVSSPMIDGHIRKQDGGERNGDEPMTADTCSLVMHTLHYKRNHILHIYADRFRIKLIQKFSELIEYISRRKIHSLLQTTDGNKQVNGTIQSNFIPSKIA